MEIIIVGAGASGVFASIILKRRGFNVKIIERNEKILKKIYATGNGRCNFTNKFFNCSNYYGENKKFHYYAINNFNFKMTCQFFEDLGIIVSDLNDNTGRCYPNSFEAKSIVEVLDLEVKHLDIPVFLNTYVNEIKKVKNKFEIISDNKKFRADAVILATGGCAYERFGSDGNGYALARKFGHNKTKTYPGIVQLSLLENCKPYKGSKPYAKASLKIDGKIVRSEVSDCLFTDYGISGPSILQLSAHALKSVYENKKTQIVIDFLYNYSEEEIFFNLLMKKENRGYKSFKQSLIGILNSDIIKLLHDRSGFDFNKNIQEFKNKDIRKIVHLSKNMHFTVKGPKSEKDGQITCGGIVTSDIDPKKIKSKKENNLYFIGEIIDVFGDCGGFNLQWAWSSAYALANNFKG